MPDMQVHVAGQPPLSSSPSRAMEVEHLDMVFKSGGSDIAALKDINFTVDDGEFIAVVGPSGCERHDPDRRPQVGARELPRKRAVAARDGRA
jgi:hypothetical protein